MHHTVAVQRRTTLLTAPVVGLLLLAACADDGRTLAPTRPGQTTTTTAPAVVGPNEDEGQLRLTTDAVADGGELPLRFTCFGQGVSISLKWAGVPADTTALAIVVRDRDADGFVHWIVTGIDPATTEIDEGRLPESAVEQVNSTGAIGWDAPCPPIGDERHIYDIVLHALSAPIDIDPALPAAEAATLVEDAAEAKADLALTVTPPAAGIGSTEP